MSRGDRVEERRSVNGSSVIAWEAHGLRCLVIESHLRGHPGLSVGWGNGYVAVPPGHPAHGKDYNGMDVDVHGGLTFAGGSDEWRPGEGLWWFGFDTAHLDDSPARWPLEAVMSETEGLAAQLADAAQAARAPEGA